MDFRPLHDRVVLKRHERQRRSPGAFWFRIRRARSRPKAAWWPVSKGKILENGTVRPIDLGMGDRVLFGTYSGTEV